MLEDLSPDDFSDMTYGWMWAATRVLLERGEPVTMRTLMTLREEVRPGKKVGQSQADFGAAIPGMPPNAPAASTLSVKLGDLMGEPIYPATLASSVRAVKAGGRLWRLISALNSAKAFALQGTADYSTVMECVHHYIDNLDNGAVSADDSSNVVRFDRLAEEFLATQSAGFRPGEVIPMPWPEINVPLSGGLHRARMMVLAGRPGAGKTNVGLGIAMHAAENGYPSLIVSQEMSALELTGRAVASGARVEYGSVMRRDMDADADAAARRYVRDNAGIPLWVMDSPGVTIEHVSAVTRAMVRHDGLSVVVIDYAQLLDATDLRVPREQQVSHISRRTKLLSRETGCAVVLLAQLNRGNAKDNRKPDVHDLRESGSLEQDPDAVMLLHHEKDSDGRPTGMVTVILGKNRFGPTVEVELRWHGHQARVGD